MLYHGLLNPCLHRWNKNIQERVFGQERDHAFNPVAMVRLNKLAVRVGHSTPFPYLQAPEGGAQRGTQKVEQFGFCFTSHQVPGLTDEEVERVLNWALSEPSAGMTVPDSVIEGVVVADDNEASNLEAGAWFGCSTAMDMQSMEGILAKVTSVAAEGFAAGQGEAEVLEAATNVAVVATQQVGPGLGMDI